MEPVIYQHIIAHRQIAKTMEDDEEKSRLSKRIADYSNALVTKRK
jgi:hypothetical protein